MDIVDKKTRSRIMACIRSKDTKPEIMVRHDLHKHGFRYKLHDKSLPGKPDIVFPKYRAAIFINGCFWHGHNCNLFKWPKTRCEFWRNKIQRNVLNDSKVCIKLSELDWRYLVIWECALKGKRRLPLDATSLLIREWIVCSDINNEIMGEE